MISLWGVRVPHSPRATPRCRQVSERLFRYNATHMAICRMPVQKNAKKRYSSRSHRHRYRQHATAATHKNNHTHQLACSCAGVHTSATLAPISHAWSQNVRAAGAVTGGKTWDDIGGTRRDGACHLVFSSNNGRVNASSDRILMHDRA